MKKIMVATDFSERSDRALRRATLLAKEYDAKLVLAHAVDADRPKRIVDAERAAAEDLLAEMTSTLHKVDGVESTYRAILDDPFAGIVAAAEEEAPDLLVLGPHRRQALRDIFVGTTAERAIRHVSCPVLMVNATPAGPYRNALAATDLSETSRAALQRLLALDFGHAMRLNVLHVFDAPALRLAMSHTMAKEEQKRYVDELNTQASLRLSDFVSEIDISPARLLVRREATTPAGEILAAATEADADLIILAKSSRAGLARFLLGSVAEQVLRSATVDVLAFPPVDGARGT